MVTIFARQNVILEFVGMKMFAFLTSFSFSEMSQWMVIDITCFTKTTTKDKVVKILKSVSFTFNINPFSTRQTNEKAKNLEKFSFLVSLKSLWTNQKVLSSHVNPPFNQGSYFDWFPFSKADQGYAIPFFANRLNIDES